MTRVPTDDQKHEEMHSALMNLGYQISVLAVAMDRLREKIEENTSTKK